MAALGAFLQQRGKPMGAQLIDDKTIPCPPPDECDPKSGEYSVVSVRRPIRSSYPAPRLAQTIEEEVRERLAGVRCPEHCQPALAELSIADDGAVQIVPVGCCDQVDRLVFATLRESPTLAPPSDPDPRKPSEPR